MAEVKISELTAKGSNLETTDLLIISKSDGSGGYDSKYITGAELTQVTIDNKTASYTLVLADANKLIEINNASANTLGVPTNATDAFPIGTQILIAQQGAGQTTITPVAGVTLRSSGGKLKIAAQYGIATLIKRATNEWYVAGDLTT
jgi:hypothetical protein